MDKIFFILFTYKKIAVFFGGTGIGTVYAKNIKNNTVYIVIGKSVKLCIFVNALTADSKEAVYLFIA